MASAQNPGPNVDLFDAYFRRADLDRDGRISGAEAVAFFQGSGLPKQVLAQIWALSDPRQIGFLGRAEFYNALRLVTVAQSKRELTPEIVKAALFSPAVAKIPAPQMNFNTQPASQFNSTPALPTPQSGIGTSTPSQSSGLESQVARNAPTNLQLVPSKENQSVRPPLATSNSSLRPAHGFPGVGNIAGPPPTNSSMSNDWVNDRAGGVQGTPSQPQPPIRGASPAGTQVGFGQTSVGLTTSLPPRPQTAPGTKAATPSLVDSKVQGFSGNGTSPGSYLGEDLFAASAVPSKQDAPSDKLSVGNKTSTSVTVPVPSATQPIVRAGSLDSLQNSFMKPPLGNQPIRNQPLGKPNQQTISQSSSSGLSTGSQNSVAGQSQRPWPRMTQTDVQKYTKVFVEVDKDRDGKITGEEARNLFLSWRLPREVLKQVWDLSDQDNDSMLSVREFCIALYLLERHREGHILPAMLPSNIVFDFSSNGHPATPAASNYSNANWRPTAGYQQHQGVPGSGNLHGAPTVGIRPHIPAAASPVENEPQTIQPKSKVPVLEKYLVNQLSTEEQNSLNSKFQEAADAEKKVEELEKEILDSKQKIEFYRTKMQELVLYKSRCDNRLNEISARVSSDKREVESLAKKYEEKYKKSGDVASKLTVEQATFRDIQEKKMELYQAIVKMEQGGDNEDGILQVRADRIQTDIEELVKTLNERCKSYGLRAKPIILSELPSGWHPGIQEEAADWDEDWDKFEDNGFTLDKELTLDVQNGIAPPKQKTKSGGSTLDADSMGEKPRSMDESAVENGSAHDNKSEDGSARSAPNSPFASSVIGSPKEYNMDSNFGKSAGFDASPRDKDALSDHGGAGSVFSGDKSYDEPAWGTFDANDDVDSVWGFNTAGSTKTNNDVNRDSYFFDSGELGLNPIRTDPFQAKKSTFAFDDSVPSTPLSPHNYREGSESNFDSFSRFDSSSVHDSGFFPPRDTFARFDSMRSSRDFDQGPGFSSFGQFDSPHSSRDFDQGGSSLTRFDSMRSSKDFDQGFPSSLSRFDSRRSSKDFDQGFPSSLSRFDSRRSSKDFDQGFPSMTRFDSMRSNADFDQGHRFSSFDDHPDPFGSTGPFRASLDNQTPKKGSDKWNAF